MIRIKTPIWKDRSVGIAEDKFNPFGTVTKIQILYRKIDGTRLYPQTFFITKEKAFTYPVMVVRGVTLRIIPIADLGVLRSS